MGSVVEYLDQRVPVRPSPSFPTYVYLPKRLGHFAGYDINGQYAGWLGPEYDGLATDISNKRSPDDNPYFRDCPDEELDFRLAGLKPIPEITIDRLNGRVGLLEQFNVQRREIDNSPQVCDFDLRRQQALSFLTSKQIGAAFDIRHESDRLRDRYGRNLFGQSLLMGRRMIEAGARFVTIGWDLPVRSNDCHSWDMHACLERVMRDHLLPGLDWGLSALLEDLEVRGLLDETLVVAVGEMGRTPAFKNRGQEDGRDHWSYCFPSVLAGAGIHGGMTYGRSDKDAAYPLDNPVSPEDLACTIFNRLGIDPRSTIPDAQGRPVPLVSDGRVLHELFS